MGSKESQIKGLSAIKSIKIANFKDGCKKSIYKNSKLNSTKPSTITDKGIIIKLS